MIERGRRDTVGDTGGGRCFRERLRTQSGAIRNLSICKKAKKKATEGNKDHSR